MTTIDLDDARRAKAEQKDLQKWVAGLEWANEQISTRDCDLIAIALDILGWQIVQKDPEADGFRKWRLNSDYLDCPEWAENGDVL
jgi:hypothetical protein